MIITDINELDQLSKPVILSPLQIPGREDLPLDYTAVSVGELGNVVYVGKSYQPVQNNQINAIVKSLVNDQGMTLIRATAKNDRQFSWTLKDLSRESKFVVAGKEFPVTFTVTINNSYDGSQALSFGYGGQIAYCQNLFGLPSKTVRAGIGNGVNKRRHTGNNLDEFTGAMVNGIQSSSKSWHDVIAGKTWELRGIANRWQQLEDLFPATSKGAHNVVQLLSVKAKSERFGSEEFDLFMAATNLATFGEEYRLPESTIDKLNQFQYSFWNN